MGYRTTLRSKYYYQKMQIEVMVDFGNKLEFFEVDAKKANEFVKSNLGLSVTLDVDPATECLLYQSEDGSYRVYPIWKLSSLSTDEVLRLSNILMSGEINIKDAIMLASL